jgi:hypothetical protein
MRTHAVLVLLAISCTLVSGCWHSPLCCPDAPTKVVIDFETLPGSDGELGTSDDVAPPTSPTISGLSDQWAAVGVHFNRGSLFYSAQGFLGSGFENYYVSSQPMEGKFSAPVYGIAITSYSKWNAKLTAFDGDDRIMAVAKLWHPQPGGPWHRGTLRVCTSEPIAKFQVIEESEDAQLILNLDRLVLTTSSP